MFLANTNLIKLFVLHFAQMHEDITIKDALVNIKQCGVEDVSVDLLSKTIKAMVEDDLLNENNKKYIISEVGYIEYKREKKNLSEIVQLLFEKKSQIPERQHVPNIFDSIKAFKTVPYRIDAFDGMSEEEFFKTKIQNPYKFGNRGLGKARLNIRNIGLEYCYDGYAILFFNAGLAQFIGVVNNYDNKDKCLQLSEIIRLSSPLTILEIRENVRERFNGSQQKQEFIEKNEVDAVIELIKTKISQFGCEVYQNAIKENIYETEEN